MKTDFFGFFHRRPEIKLNRRLFVFIVCLLISFFGWFQSNLSKQYTDTVPVRVDFVNLPKTRFGTAQVSDTIAVEVEASGFELMKYKMKNMAVDFRKLKKSAGSEEYFYLANNNTKPLAKKMGDNFRVIRAMTDTVVLVPAPH